MPADFHTVANHIVLWVDVGGVIHIKIDEPYGDPVELNEHEAGELVDVLQKLIDKEKG